MRGAIIIGLIIRTHIKNPKKKGGIMGRYFCQRDEINLPMLKANKVCLLKRCPNLFVKYRGKRNRKWINKYKQAIPNTLTELVDCVG